MNEVENIEKELDSKDEFKIVEVEPETQPKTQPEIQPKTQPESKEDDLIINDLPEADELYLDAKKTELLNVIDSGEIKTDMQKYALVDVFILDVLFHHPNKAVFVQYLKDQKEIKDKINQLTQQIMPINKKQRNLIENYSENAKDMLEQIRLL